MSNQELSKQVDYILSPEAIRERTLKIYEAAKKGETHFAVHEEKLDEVSSFVLEVINKNYPDHDIPFHSRWGHFQVGEIDRLSEFDRLVSNFDKMEQARCKLDLVITSVLLDAGAGKDWSYQEKSSGRSFDRSEGLAVASYYMFLENYFSNTSGSFQANGEALKKLSAKDLESAFQVDESNPLVGVAGRVGLLNKLGETVLEKKSIFKDARPGNIIDYLVAQHGSEFKVKDVLRAVLLGLGSIWPGRLEKDGVNLGDVWEHSLLGAKGSFESYVPFHKLSQWLTYSLVGPMEEAGLMVSDAHELTGLAEYRNGGLLLDRGLISLRNQENMQKAHRPNSELIIEWRALTVVMLDKIGEIVCEKLGKTAQEFPLAKVLEGGTWWAGRIAAKELRADGTPPLRLDSDGTVF